MKRLLPLLAVFALALSACTLRVDIGVIVNEDESGSFSLFTGADEELRSLAEQGGESFDITEGLEDVPDGWRVEEAAEDGFEGARVSADFDSFDELEALIAELNESGDGEAGTDLFTDVSLVRNGDEFRFTADVSGLSDELAGSLSEGGGEDLFSGLDPTSFFSDLFEIRFTLTLPGTIGANNADTVDGNMLVWNVSLLDDSGTYEAVSTVGEGGVPWVLLLIVLAVIGVLVAAFLMMRQRREATPASPFGDVPTPSEGSLPADPFAG